MAIGARISPVLLAVGEVTGHRRQSWEGEYTGTQVTIEAEGGPLVIKFRADADISLPIIGSTVAVWSSVYDGARGSSLTFERYATGDDLAEIERTFQPVGK